MSRIKIEYLIFKLSDDMIVINVVVVIGIKVFLKGSFKYLSLIILGKGGGEGILMIISLIL